MSVNTNKTKRIVTEICVMATELQTELEVFLRLRDNPARIRAFLVRIESACSAGKQAVDEWEAGRQ